MKNLSKFLFISEDVLLCKKMELEVEKEPAVRLVGAVNDCKQAIKLTKRHSPQVVVVDATCENDAVGKNYLAELKNLFFGNNASVFPRILALIDGESDDLHSKDFSITKLEKAAIQNQPRSMAESIIENVCQIIASGKRGTSKKQGIEQCELSPRQVAMEDWLQTLFVRLGIYEKIGAVYLTYAIPFMLAEQTNHSTFRLNDAYEIIEKRFRVGSRKTIETAIRTLVKAISDTDFSGFDQEYAELLKSKFILTPKRLVVCFYNLLKNEFASKATY